MNCTALREYFRRLRARWWRGWCIAAFDDDPDEYADTCRILDELYWAGHVKNEQLVERIRELEAGLVAARDRAAFCENEVMEIARLCDRVMYRKGDADEPA